MLSFQISDEVGLGFPTDHIFALADPGPGKSADKGALIKAHMAKHGILPHQALFADDSAGNIKSAKGKYIMRRPIPGSGEFSNFCENAGNVKIGNND